MRALNIRAGEHRTVAAGFFTLFGLVASHAILETARDALFLSKIAASKLPYVYIAIAVASLLVTQLQARLSAGRSLRSALMASTAGAAAVTAGFWVLLPSFGDLGLYALYVWSGVLTTLVLVYFWSLLADAFTVTQAKRLYSLVGVGSVLGAVAGSGLASVLARVIAPVNLVLAAAIGFGLAAATPMLFEDEGAPTSIEGVPIKKAASLTESAAYVGRNVYARRIVVLLIAAAATLTMADYVFKAEVVGLVAKEDLGSTFATIYFVVNVFSLITQVFVVGRVIKRLGLGPSLCVLPFCLALGATGIFVGGGLVAAVALKGMDGTLRYSVHKTATELLFVPLTEEARRSVKGFIDVIGQRGGQAIASGLILGVVALGVPHRIFAAMVVAMAAVWIVVAVGLRTPYLALIRTHLQEVRRASAAFPELDIASLETLIASLDSADHTEALVALNTLHREDKLRLVPGLILYHPSATVVDRALTLFGRSGRTKTLPIIDWLLDHDSPRIRSAAIAARTALIPDDNLLRKRYASESAPEVRATIRMNLIVSGAIDGEDANDWIEEQLSTGSDETKVEIACTIGRLGGSGQDDVVVRLSEDRSLEVRQAAIETMRQHPRPAFSRALAMLLGDNRVRGEVRTALLDHGDAGFAELQIMLEDRAAPPRLRWQVPVAIAAFDPQRALDILLNNLRVEDDGMVRFRSVRSIERLVRRNPNLSIDDAAIRKGVAATIGRAYRYLEQRIALETGAEEDGSRKTDGHLTLVRMLRDKEHHAVNRLFRLLGLMFPSEDFVELLANLESEEPAAQASSMELIEDLLKGSLRDAVVGLIDDLPDEQRLSAAGAYHSKGATSYEEVLGEMLAGGSEAIVAMTVYHIGELKLERFANDLEAIDVPDADRGDVALALERLGRNAVPFKGQDAR